MGVITAKSFLRVYIYRGLSEKKLEKIIAKIDAKQIDELEIKN